MNYIDAKGAIYLWKERGRKKERGKREGEGEEALGETQIASIVPHSLKTGHSEDLMVLRSVTQVDAVTYYLVVSINTEETISLFRQLHN